MPDLHDSLDNEARRVRSEPGALGDVLDRANRRRRTRRITSGILALAIAGGGIGLAFAAFRSTDQLQPGTGPVPGPSVTTSPEVRSIPGLDISNDTSTEGAAEFTVALLAGEGIVPRTVFVQGGALETTTIHCHPLREDEAIWLRDRFFPGAELRPRIDAETILVRLGEDFLRDHDPQFGAFMTVRSFMTRRVEGSGAELFLSAGASEGFDDELAPSLYGYVRGGAFLIRTLIPRDDGTAVVEVDIVTPEGGDAVASERLTVGDSAPQDGRPDILAVELTSPPDTGWEQIRIFVRQFLRARRQASGAGTFLGTDARNAYASHEGGLDLLGYASGGSRSHIVAFDKLSPERSLVQVRFSGLGGHVFEALTVERLGQTMFVIADAERA